MSEHVLTLTGLDAPTRQAAADVSKKPATAADTNTKRGQSIEYRALFLVTFAVFLVAAIVEALIPRSWKAHSYQSNETIWRRASIGAKTCVAYAFMG